MNVKDQETLNELLKKLSAVRVTLSDEEQEMLDWLIQGPRSAFVAEDVKAQSFKYQAAPVKQSGPDEAMHANVFKNAPQPAPTPGPDEVHANVFKNAPQPAPTPGPDEVHANVLKNAPQPAPTPGPDEVHANILKNAPQSAPTPGPDEVAASSMTVTQPQGVIVLIYDPETEAYRYIS